ncbi:hypothetical protein P7C70_g5591, partial [Phenoliferia sp. Uapishka_3]
MSLKGAPPSWPRRDSPPFEQPMPEYEYGAALPSESKKEKRRRDMVDRVSRLHVKLTWILASRPHVILTRPARPRLPLAAHRNLCIARSADTLERRDRVFHDLSGIFARTADDLLPPPPIPPIDMFEEEVDQLTPSLPFTDSRAPFVHPTPYLFGLHRLSHQRENSLLAIRLFHAHQVSVARKLYEAEVERVEEEYEGATKGVVERLLEGVEDRRRRLTDEKEGEGVSLDNFFDPQSRAHGTRRLRGGGTNRTQSTRPATLLATNSNDSLALSPGSLPLDSHVASSLLGINGVSDPFNLAASLLPSSANGGPLLSSLSGVGPTASLLSGGLGKRKPGPRTQPGLPPAHFLVQSGTYSQFGKSLAGISALRGDEIDGDLNEVRRKRPRVAAGGAGSRRRQNGD